MTKDESTCENNINAERTMTNNNYIKKRITGSCSQNITLGNKSWWKESSDKTNKFVLTKCKYSKCYTFLSKNKDVLYWGKLRWPKNVRIRPVNITEF